MQRLPPSHITRIYYNISRENLRPSYESYILVEWCLHLQGVLSGATLKATEDVLFAGQNSCEVAE